MADNSLTNMAAKTLPANASDGSLVRRFYTGASVLITGGTGFMGKVLIEKLLWACPDVTAIYVLVREKKGQTAQERIHTLLESQCFDRLRESRGPEFGSKLIAVQGDMTDEQLGLNDLDRDLLTDHVSVVFHVAATVRFDEPFHVAVTQNVRATRELVGLCRNFSKLKALVHVSTAFAHCPHQEIKEQFYDSPMDCDLAIKMAVSGELTTEMTEKLLGAWPNTYTFTKALAEEVIRKHGAGLPVCVFRPAIVVSAMSEPVEGWVDNMAGPGVALAGILTGYIRVMPGDREKEAALVPCDMVIDAMLAAAWDCERSRENGEIPIYNFSTSPCNRITWFTYFNEYVNILKDMPSIHAIWSPGCVEFTNYTTLSLCRLVMQTLPAGIFDVALTLAGKKPFAKRLYSKINTTLDVYAYFTTRQWSFQEKNVPALWEKLGDRDRELFNFDMRSLDWKVYAEKTSPGIRRFILKEDPETIPTAAARYQRIMQTKQILQALIALLVTYALFTRFMKYIRVNAFTGI